MAMIDKINELAYKKSKLELGGGKEAIERQHSLGKLTARERLARLFDPNSFVEIDAFVEARCTDFNMQEKKSHGDGVVVGYGSINERLVYAAAQDYTFIVGALGEMHAKKIAKVMDMAVKTGSPFINLIDSNGARIQEGLDALAGYGDIFTRSAKASGVIPQISVIMGPCAGGGAFSPVLSDFVFMVEKNSYMFVNGSQVVSAVTGNNLTEETLGGTEVHSKKSGIAHFVYENEDVCLNKVRELIDLLPDNNLSDVPVYESNDYINRLIDDLNSDFVDRNDVTNIIRSIVDETYFLEIQKDYAPNIVVGLARMNGATVGILANQYNISEGRLDSNASAKGARFVRFCDSFNIPVVTFTNVTGFKVDADEEQKGLVRDGAKLMYSFAEATVPKINIIIGKAYGSAYVAMNSKHIGADLVFAWPNADISIMSAEAASNILFRNYIAEAEDPVAAREEKIKEYRETYANPYIAASMGYVDDIFEPGATRVRLISALDMLASKRESGLPKKHGNIPL